MPARGSRLRRLGAAAASAVVVSAALVSAAVVTTPAYASSGAAVISAGFTHNCVLTAAGGVQCWGINSYGQLGDGTVIQRAAPAVIPNAVLRSGVLEVSAGGYHTCALTTGGRVKCWGSNLYGQLGDGTTTDSHERVSVPGLSGITAVAAGGYHTCVLTSVGGVKCWGSGYRGQLGDGNYYYAGSPVPLDVLGLSTGVSAIAAGADYTCALTTGGGVKCWGTNTVGELGDGTNTIRPAPVDVVGLTSGVAAISAGGDHTCALTTGGGVKCWGYNDFGQVGDGTTTYRYAPVDVVGLTSGVAAISAGGDHTCALTTAGDVKCWGSNVWGEMGDGTHTDRYTPITVPGLTGPTAQVSSGGVHTCILTTDGGVRCWGYNHDGQLGDGTYTPTTAAVDTLGFTPTTTKLALKRSTVSSAATERFTVKVKADLVIPDGTAEVYIDDVAFSSGTLVGGTLILTLPMSAVSPGVHTVRAVYDGSGLLSSSVGPEKTVTVT